MTMLHFQPDVGSGITHGDQPVVSNDDPGSSDANFDAALSAAVEKQVERREVSTPDDTPEDVTDAREELAWDALGTELATTGRALLGVLAASNKAADRVISAVERLDTFDQEDLRAADERIASVPRYAA